MDGTAFTEEQRVTTIAAEVPVVEVTLLEDRALVVRRGVVELPPGRSRLRIDGVAPVLVDKTLAAALALPPDLAGQTELPEDLRVRSARVTRRRITRDAERPKDLAELRQRRRDKQAELDALEQRRARTTNDHASLGQLIDLTITEITEDVGWARQDRQRWAEQLAQLEAEQLELTLALRRIGHQHELLTRELGDLEQLEAASSSLASEVAATLELELINPEAIARRVELTIDYLVPGALWRPWHSARLIDAGAQARLEFTCEGAVWQNTGEDWRDVQLIFSTERPSLGVAPPTLATDTLYMRKKGPAVQVETRDQTVHTAGLGADDGVKKKVASDELPGIDDGGEALGLRGRVKATVPGDGRPYRVPIFSFEAPAETALICMPERVAAVMLRSRQPNSAEHPLLAGPVDLIRNSGLVGRTSILFIAPGERFELGWGPDPALRVTREVEQLDHERKMMSSWTRKPRRVRIKLSNLAPTATTVEVTERIAVSEVEKVEVELARSSHGQKADDDGFVSWTVKLPGFGHEELELTWVLVVHDDVAGL
ncbi:MAG TPA: mucoidy inhibitor MuiA family protein [Enhygromyxa sp.]|nr:mucoidy inhibitor MuiA family protein [Enhygromyxa sp.]